jgi:hypothetical protein
MARVIILSFDDNAAAERFAKHVMEGQRLGLGTMTPSQGVQVEAMVARPTVACRGPHRVPGKLKSQMGWTRTIKFGWWVCSVCNKPAPAVVRDFIQNMLGGYNDLLPTVTGGEPRPPKHIRR